MDLEKIEALARSMATENRASAVLEEDGLRVTLRRQAPKPAAPHHILRAPWFGHFRRSHPLRAEAETPVPRSVAVGDRVRIPHLGLVGNVVEVRGRKLVALAGGMRLKYNSFDLPMEHWHYDVFRAQYEEMDISMMMNFHSDMNGTIYQLSTSLEPLVDDIVFKKLPPRRLSDPTFLERLAGKYKMEKGDVTANVELRGTVLYATLPGQPTYTLEPFTGTEFKIKDLNGYSVEFHLDGSGKTTSGLSVIQPEGVFKATREE